MERIIDSELRGLETMIARMCGLAHEAISTALHESLYYGDKAVEIILKFQPVASDLRMVKTFMRISYDLARLGRYALDIAYVNKRFNGVKSCDEWIREYVKDMSQKVMSMVELSLASIRNKSLKGVREASDLEREVDELYKSFLDKIAKDTSESRAIVSSVLIVRYLERVADHVVYAYEALIYMLTGRRELIE